MLKYKITPIFQGEIIDSKFKMTDDEYGRYRKFCLSHTGPIQFILKKKFSPRSRKQDGYYFGLVLPMIAEEMGIDNIMEVHAILKGMFLVKGVTVKGKEYQAVGRYAKLSTQGQQEFVEKCRRWASMELQVDIPDPEKNWNCHPVLVDSDL